MVITRVIVTLDGADSDSSGALSGGSRLSCRNGGDITSMVQAFAVQVAIVGLDEKRGRTAEFEREIP